MLKLIQKILLTLMMASASLAFAGQHSGLGGGAPPKSKPAPDRSLFETLEEYYITYYEWLRTQVGADDRNPQLELVEAKED